jgi:FkbM family methyltransferase
MIELNTISKIPNDKDIIVKYGYEHFRNYYVDCELNHKQWWNENIKDNWTIIDAGANIGIFSILFARKAKKVYAFEPCKETVEIMRKNIKENENGDKIEIIPLALSDHSTIKKDKIHHIWSTEPLNEEFQFITIDKFVEDNKVKVDAIKIDVDSYDFEVLKGSKNTLLSQRPVVIVEVVNVALNLRGYNHTHIFEFMKSINYEYKGNLDSDNCLFYPIADHLQKLQNLAYNADIYAEKEVKHLIKYTNTKIGIETGTSFGSTTLHLSTVLDKVYSAEIMESSYNEAKNSLNNIKNISLYLGSSEQILEKIFKEEKMNENENIFFYLDAHWNSYWPILDELEIISKYCNDRAIICIDDFQTPNRDYGFDSYNNQPLNYDYIKDKLSKVYPNGYTYWYADLAKKRTGYEYKGIGGKFYVVSNKIKIDWLKQENGINYSVLIKE